MVHTFLAVDELRNHLLGVIAHGGQVESEVNLGHNRRSGDVHQAVYADIVAGKRFADVQV